MVRPAFATNERNEGGPGPGGREAAVARIGPMPSTGARRGERKGGGRGGAAGNREEKV